MDVTQAVSQDEIADSLVSEPEVQEGVQDAGTEDQLQDQGEELGVEQQEGEQLEEDADWLPEEQRTFSDGDLLRYAQRYQKDEQWLSDPLNRQLLIDKINTDIFVRQQQQSQFEPEEEPESEPVRQEPTQQLQPIPIQQWIQNAQTFARQNGLINPDIAQAFAKQFMGAFGVNEMPKDFNAEAFTEPFVIFGMNLVNSLMPLYFNSPADASGRTMLQQFVESQYDGMGELAQRSAYSSAWNAARGNNQLPDYGTPEFREMMEKVSQEMPDLENMKFADANGKPLGAKANAQRQYQIAIRIAQGKQLSPALVKQAVETGKRQARQSQVRKQSGNLGAGNSKQQFSQQSNDDFFAPGADWSQYLDRKL